MTDFLSPVRWRSWYIALVVAGILVNLLGLHSSILEPDGALYASIAKTMVLNGDWVNLYAHNRDWLDKPHFPFWMTAISYSIFGINEIAYKIPALVFWALGGWYTFQIGRKLYSEQVAQVALLIYLTALHLVISNNDVRAEPYLTGLLAGCVYYWLPDSPDGWHRTGRVLLGALYMAAAIMTKGIFILIPVVGAFLLHWALNGQLKAELSKPKWWIALGLVGVFILPELLTLYWQFDQHPEKVVFGRTGVSGLRFFFWDSQFGRFMNTGPIKGKGDPFFFLHTLLWAFLPWSILLYIAMWEKIKGLVRREKGEWVLPGISLICFLLFSASRFQLPHYMNIVFPFFAIVTADWLLRQDVESKKIRVLGGIQVGISILLLAGCIGLWGLMYLTNFRPLVYVLSMAIIWNLLRKKTATYGFGLPARMVLITSLAAITLYGFLNLYFYPALLQYQSGEQVAKQVNQQEPGQRIYQTNPLSYSLDFYSDGPVRYTDRTEVMEAAKDSAVLYYSTREQRDTLVAMGVPVQMVDSFAHYHISKLKIGFLLPDKRPKYLQYRYLMEVGPRP
jgi:4-amino-4-deoxy-L-arabinose transferase-like glycosyltransferase